MPFLRRELVSNILLCAVWGAGSLTGLYALAVYSSTPATVLALEERWPEGTSIVRASDRPTMLIALHPRCVCSQATVAQLARVVARLPEPPRIDVLLYQPENAPASWSETDLVLRARSLPGVTIRPDSLGRESERFRLSVSGQTAIYSPEGHLMFTGGITRARGHEGDNAGSDAILSILGNHRAGNSNTPVFGCPIQTEI